MTETDILHLIGTLRSSRNNPIPGDDIAALTAGKKTYAASDSLIEGIHYRRTWLTPAEIAYKLFARNWSDFLCKGIRPSHCLMNLNLKPGSATKEFLAPFLRELDRLLTRHHITLVGGDTARSKHDSFTLTFIGSRGKFIPRKAAAIRKGDVVVILGAVGGATYAVSRGMRVSKKERSYFAKPPVFEKLPGGTKLKATIDQSDSVHKSLSILAQMNGIDLTIDLGNIPRSHAKIRPAELPAAAEDLAVFAIATRNPSPAFRVIGHVESIHAKHPGVRYWHRGKPVLHDARGFEHFK